MTVRCARRMEVVRPSAIRDLLRHGADPGMRLGRALRPALGGG
jgi:hypothetical protein